MAGVPPPNIPGGYRSPAQRSCDRIDAGLPWLFGDRDRDHMRREEYRTRHDEWLRREFGKRA